MNLRLKNQNCLICRLACGPIRSPVGCFALFFFASMNAEAAWAAPVAAMGRKAASGGGASGWPVSLGLALGIALAAGVLIAAGAVLWARRDPQGFLRLTIGSLLKLMYRLRPSGLENIPKSGGGLIVANHQSFLDPVLIGFFSPRPIRFLVAKEMADKWWVHWITVLTRAIPISALDPPRKIIEALHEARADVQRGDLVGIFPEGQITRIGMMLPFQRGLRQIVRNLDVPIIPIAIDGAYETRFGPRVGRWDLGRRWRPWRRSVISLCVGKAMPSSTPPHELRRAVVELMGQGFANRRETTQPLHRDAVHCLRQRAFSRIYADQASRRPATGGQFLAAAVALGRRLRPLWAREPMVGVFLPPTMGAAAVNLAAAMGGRVAVNLNYTASRAILGEICSQCNIRRIITSRAFLQKSRTSLPEGIEAVYLEDLRAKIGRGERLMALALALFAPVGRLERMLGRQKPAKIDDLCTVIFSSGSTGKPKGVELTHWGIQSNIVGAFRIAHFGPRSCLLGILPFFHSFGYTVAFWLPIAKGVGVAWYPNPLDARSVGAHVARYKVTHLFGTPSFLSIYARRVQPGQFGSLTYVQTGAEKLRDSVAAAFERRFGIRPIEGYGTTECSPVVAMNALDYRVPGMYQRGSREGSIGHPLPGVEVRIVDIDTGETLDPGKSGMMLVRGPNVMRGYYKMPEKTAEAIRDGWYVTGDIAEMDVDGYVRITDRLARFSKIGGEMIPHIRIEEALQEAAGCVDIVFAVTSATDAAKGERLMVLHTLPEGKAREAAAALQKSGLPALWIPKWQDFVAVETLPLLGSGKLDLQAAKRIAAEAAARSSSRAASPAPASALAQAESRKN